MINTVTATEIKHVENSFEVLNEFGSKIDLNSILVREYRQELSSEINCWA